MTRAKEVVYVVGNRPLWREAGVFRELDSRLAQWEEAEQERQRQAERDRREAERMRQEQARQQQDAKRAAERLAERERAERMEQWKLSGMPREWVLQHLDGWDHATWMSLWSQVQGTPFSPLNADEVVDHLEALRDELQTERDRKAEEERQREAQTEARRGPQSRCTAKR